MQNTISSYVICVLVLLLSVSLIGCDSTSKSEVSGLVTLDGDPVPNCTLEFASTSDGPGGLGIGDGEGRYEAYMSKNNLWLAPGEYRVAITTPADDAESGEAVGASAVMLPNKYKGRNSELTATVEPGKNEINFELTSD